MKRKTLANTNPYLRNPELRALMVEKNVATSTAIEGIRISKAGKKRKVSKSMLLSFDKF